MMNCKCCGCMDSCTYEVIERCNQFKQTYVIPCGTSELVSLWQAQNVDHVSGTFSVTVESACSENPDIVFGFRDGTSITYALGVGSSIVVTISDISEIAASCPGTGVDNCTITICASVNYEVCC